MLAERAALRLGEGSLAWVEDYCSGSSLAYLNGNILVLMNTGDHPMALPPGELILRSSAAVGAEPQAADQISSGETIWLKAS